MQRKVIATAALQAMIDQKFESLPECRNLHVTIGLDRSRAHGANWTTTYLRRSGGDHDEVACQWAISKFMAELQARYDIDA